MRPVGPPPQVVLPAALQARSRSPSGLALSGVALSLLLCACPKSAGRPSPEFDQANKVYTGLLAKDGPSDVFGDSRISEVVGLLSQVPADSVDAAAASSLSQTIAQGQKDFRAQTEERDEAVAAASAPPTGLDFAPPAAPQPAAPAAASSPAAATRVDAGAPPTSGPQAGMKLDEFNAKYGSCFSRGAVWDDSTGNSGDSYVLVTSNDCTQRLGAFSSKMVLINKGGVFRVIDKSSAGAPTTLNLKSESTVQPAAPQPAPAPPPAPPPPASSVPPPAPNIGTTPDQLPQPDDLTKTNLQPLNN